MLVGANVTYDQYLKSLDTERSGKCRATQKSDELERILMDTIDSLSNA